MTAISMLAISTPSFLAFSKNRSFGPISNRILCLSVSMYNERPCLYLRFGDSVVFSTSPTIFNIAVLPVISNQTYSASLIETTS